jgi:hypothetical protein
VPFCPHDCLELSGETAAAAEVAETAEKFGG